MKGSTDLRCHLPQSPPPSAARTQSLVLDTKTALILYTSSTARLGGLSGPLARTRCLMGTSVSQPALYAAVHSAPPMSDTLQRHSLVLEISSPVVTPPMDDDDT